MPLHIAADISAASTKLLIEAGADVNAKDLDGTPILIHTTWNNRTEAARLLIEAGADVNAKDELRDGNSILFSALINKSPDVARLLLENGADIGTGLSSNIPLLQIAVSQRLNTNEYKHKIWWDQVARLLIEYGADTTGIDLSWMESQ
jgi:ankyrin repeat protein